MTKEIPLTKGGVALVDDEDYERANQYKWRAQKIKRHWYAFSWVNTPLGREKTTLHRFLLNAKRGEYCDHINMDGLDNRRCNLRIVTNVQNTWNAKKRSKSKSKYKGLAWDKRLNQWQVGIKVDGKRIFFGRFSDEEDAAHAYDEAARKYRGEYARLNFPMDWEESAID